MAERHESKFVLQIICTLLEFAETADGSGSSRVTSAQEPAQCITTKPESSSETTRRHASQGLSPPSWCTSSEKAFVKREILMENAMMGATA